MRENHIIKRQGQFFKTRVSVLIEGNDEMRARV